MLKSTWMRSHAATSAITDDTLLIITSTHIIIIIMWPRWRDSQPVAFMIAHNRPIGTHLRPVVFHLLIRLPKIKSSLRLLHWSVFTAIYVIYNYWPGPYSAKISTYGVRASGSVRKRRKIAYSAAVTERYFLGDKIEFRSLRVFEGYLLHILLSKVFRNL